MKKNILLLVIPSILLVTSCGRGDSPSSSSSSSSISPTSITSITSSVQPIDIEHIPVNLTAINDFHGYIEEDGYYVGLSKLGTYLKNKKREGNILINSGDSYQGTYLSNYTKGNLITKAFKDIGFDAITIGNHEFDWGDSSIRDNESVFGESFLGANIYKYPKSGSSWEKADLGSLYKIVKLYEGTEAETKVGIIGVIGDDQITSISSLKVQNYVFLNPTSIIKNLSDELRAAGCDIVVADYHSGEFDDSITSISSTSKKKYVDAIFTSHTHRAERYILNNVPILQGGAYGEYASNISLELNKNTKEVIVKQYKNDKLIYEYLNEDQSISRMINEVKEITDPIAQEIVGNNVDGYMDRYDVARFYAGIASKKVAELNYNVDYVLFEYARKDLKGYEFTFEDLYMTNPFENTLFILSVSQENIEFELSMGAVGYNSCNIDPSVKTGYSDVLVYDYNGLHQGINHATYEKYYNYFPSAFTEDALHEPILLEGLEVFNLAIKHLKLNPNILKSDYSGSRYL